jgi:hypothetical protein
MQLSVNGVVVTCNPSKVELRVRFPLNANFFVFCAHIQYVVTIVPGGKPVFLNPIVYTLAITNRSSPGVDNGHGHGRVDPDPEPVT